MMSITTTTSKIMDYSELNRNIYSLESEIIFFPVRHHSPAAARLVRQLIKERQPSLVLIEGPSDFNDRLNELLLPHQLPIAIYSYIHTADDLRRGAFYPFCIYSPEWQALQTARDLNIPVQFIDQPWSQRATDRQLENAYSDEALTRGDYVDALCAQLGIEGLDALWDTLFEIDDTLTIEQYMERCHQFCWHLRQSDGHVSSSDLEREAFMVDRIRQQIPKYRSPVLVITGGYHSSALHRAIQQSAEMAAVNNKSITPPIAQGIALTPYTYDRLDNLRGYNAGMPNPGFYHTVWQQRETQQIIAPSVLQKVIQALRKQKQIASTADLIAVQTLAQGLADLRGHREIWRSDLIDGVIGGLVKDDLGSDTHPFLATLQEILRGSDRGILAPGTPLPPLVQDLHQRLQEFELLPGETKRSIELNLTPNIAVPTQRPASALLHSLRLLQITGIQAIGGTDFATRIDLTDIWERWELQWTPDFDSSSIEAAIYGATVTEATIAKLQERANGIDRNAEQAALLLLDAALAGVDGLAEPLTEKLMQLVQQEGNFLGLARSLGHLLYLYRYDEVLGTKQQAHVAQLLAEAFQRGLWLLDSLGSASGEEDALLEGLGSLVEAYQRSMHLLVDYREPLLAVLQRVSQDRQQSPLLRGGAIGSLWVLGETPMEQILLLLNEYAQPEQLGDFLTGLFHIARETTQRDGQLIASINEAICAYTDDDFLAALPSMRLAFAYFTPREKNEIAKTLLQGSGSSDLSDFLNLPLGLEVATQAIALESQIFQLIDRYGLRGGSQ
jgi:Family of unknown function (DUF5682)